METREQNTAENNTQKGAKSRGQSTGKNTGKNTDKNIGKNTTKLNFRERILIFLENGQKKRAEIIEELSGDEAYIDSQIRQLCEEGKIERVERGIYQLRQIETSAARTPADNEETINKLLNLYDNVLDGYNDLMQKILNSGIDLEKKANFLKNFKDLTMIADRLMKRWALVHVGYDTNSRQAQEDAKAKTEERQKAALKEAPLEEQVSVIGSFDLETKQLIDNFPTLEDLTEKDTEEITV